MLSLPIRIRVMLPVETRLTTTMCWQQVIMRRRPTLNCREIHCRFPQRRCLTSSSSSSSSTSTTPLSRSERRALERKQRNKERRASAKPSSSSPSTTATTTTSTSRFQQLVQDRAKELFHPRLFGSGQRIHRDHLWYLAVRLPLACVLAYALTDSNLAPFSIQASLGPSMLPTMQFIGDLWLVETGTAWRTLALQTGDVVLWKDATTGRVSCKRIIGLPGQVVGRFGEYASIYDSQNNYGIVWPKNKHTTTMTAWDPVPDDTSVNRTLIVPDGHVWLEGDCPPFSLDSRHYGPIPMDWICGRILLRVWPLQDNYYFQDMPTRQSKWIRTMPRPKPLPSPEEYLGKQFNFYRLSAPTNQKEKEE